MFVPEDRLQLGQLNNSAISWDDIRAMMSVWQRVSQGEPMILQNWGIGLHHRSCWLSAFIHLQRCQNLINTIEPAPLQPKLWQRAPVTWPHSFVLSLGRLHDRWDDDVIRSLPTALVYCLTDLWLPFIHVSSKLLSQGTYFTNYVFFQMCL